MHEDDVYRTTTQYRLWSFTPVSLASLRANTNTLAAERVRVAIKRARVTRSSKAPSENGSAPTSEAEGSGGVRNGLDRASEDKEIDCLTVEEEQKIVGHYINVTFTVAKNMDVPIQITVCAALWITHYFTFV